MGAHRNVIDYPEGWEKPEPKTNEDAYILAVRLQEIVVATTSREVTLEAMRNLVRFLGSSVNDLNLKARYPEHGETKARQTEVTVMDGLSIAESGKKD